ncbi:Glutamine amidotransferase-like protein chyE [Colletotrichum siamense]|uniref:Glutamine amidotransferase-like protein chyE n=1 Tax=Colletotrichum siamense TaxID=690259 RepID=A0A9P5K998_COLSI|nr:Glutamine amidotransferase-like protein chyE [Colletotrichum siamense]KAF4864105.1 Glutamine amidotransferase-like protein chyE [Colletotrichum siamense]
MAFRVAILANFDPDEPGGSEMLSRITTLLRCSRTGATEITVHAAIRGDAFPDPSEYDLVILTGGPFNLLKHTEENERPEWVRRTLGWIQETVKIHEASGLSEPGSKKKAKLLGICWGHQAISLALGGRLGQVPQERGGQSIGVETVPLTSQGAAFFKTESLDIQKNHALVVTHPGPYLTPIASGSSSSQNEVLLSHSPPILTFQGHPEMDAALARLFAGFATGGASDRADWIPSEGLKGIDDVHDGEAILKRVMAWADE